jgi:hypothetical protein
LALDAERPGKERPNPIPLAHACRRDGAANRRYRKTLHGVLARVGCGMN